MKSIAYLWYFVKVKHIKKWGIIRVMRQRLGQHFLVNKSAIERIITALDLQKNDIIIEIGPGEGALTIPLAKECEKIGCKIIAIEKDPNLAKKLGENLQLSIPNFQMVVGDALRILPKLATDWKLEVAAYGEPRQERENWKLTGNIPYYITGKLLRILSELDKKPELIVLTIQKEVAERIIAQPPRMNLLAAAVQIWAEPKIIGYLKPKDFSPPPEVESIIIQLTTKAQLPTAKELEKYYKLIKILFKQPRKTILNNLEAGWSAKLPNGGTNLSAKLKKNGILKILHSVGLQGNERPQNLSIETIQKLSIANLLF